MVTFYIDIYFLINLTVDTLAIYFASLFSGLPLTKKRAVLGAALGSLIATATVLLPDFILLKLFGAVLGLIAVTLICAYTAGVRRKIRFMLAFLIFCALLGGAATYLFSLFEHLISESIGQFEVKNTNRKLLLVAVAILLSIGLFKIVVAFFSGGNASGVAEVKIVIIEKSFVLEGFIDSGNLAKDPIDGTPVILIKEEIAKGILPGDVESLGDPQSWDIDLRKRFRLIPINTAGGKRMLAGIKPDEVYLKCGKNFERVRAVLAIDREEGDFDGFGLLVPAVLASEGRK